MTAANAITIDISTSPELAALFEGKEAGDACEFTVTMKVKEITEDEVIGVIEKVAQDYDGEEEEEAVPTPEEPMAMKIGETATLYPHGEDVG